MIIELECSNKPPSRNVERINFKCIYDLSHDIGRLINLYPDSPLSLLTNEQKQLFKDLFSKAFIVQVKLTRGYVKYQYPDCISFTKQQLSEITFLKNEIFNFYVKLCDNNIVQSRKIRDAIKICDKQIENLENYLENWKNPALSDEVQEYEDSRLPNLNEVPPTHYWWTVQQREFWKNNHVSCESGLFPSHIYLTMAYHYDSDYISFHLI